MSSLVGHSAIYSAITITRIVLRHTAMQCHIAMPQPMYGFS